MSKKREYEIRSGSITRSNPESRKVCGYAVRFSSDSVDMGFTEVIKPGAITEETIQRSDVLALLNHDDQKVLARCKRGNGSMKLEVREEGLYYEFDAPNTIYGDELLEQLSRGDITQSSFAFTVSTEEGADNWYRDANGNLRRDINKIDRLFDCSPVYFPAYELTTASRRSLDALSEEAEKVKDELNNEVLAVQEEVKDLKDQVEEIKDTVEAAEEEKPAEKPAEAEETAPAEEPTEEPAEEPKKDDAEEASTEDETPAEEPETKPSEEPAEEPEDAPKNDDDEEINNKDKRNKNSKTINSLMKENNFSFIKAIRSVVNGTQPDAYTAAVLDEGKKSFRDAGIGISGQIQVPLEKRVFTVTTEHDDVIETEFDSLLTPMYATRVLSKARWYRGLVGDLQIPILEAGEEARWEGETTSSKEITNTAGSLKLTPHRISVSTKISKQMLAQDSIGVESAIREDLFNNLYNKLEATFLSATAASGNVPGGIFAGKTAESVTDFKGICELEAGIEEHNFNGSLEYVFSPAAKAAFRQMTFGGGRVQRMVMEGNEIDGVPYSTTTNVTKNYFGLLNWESVRCGQWAGLDLVVDPYTSARTNEIVLTLTAFFDCKVARPELVVYGTITPKSNNPG